MRRTTTLTALLLGATLLSPIGAATAAGETCRGEVATIVGTGPDVQGTEGRDVIVTGSSLNVFAGAGDDVVCVTGTGSNANLVDVDAGAGNDVVDSTMMERYYYLTAILGDGSDTFVGGREADSVVAGAAASSDGVVPSESERDVIETGDGSDDVASGGPGLPNDDVVRTGSGADRLTWSGVMGAASVLDAGEGDDMLTARASGASFGIDLAAGTLTRNGVREATFTSIESLGVTPEPDLGSLGIIGTGGEDVIDLDVPVTLQVDLGGGDDTLRLTAARAGSRIDLGSGSDLLRAASTQGSVDLDLAAGTLVVDGSEPASVAGVEDVDVSAEDARVIGSSRRNSLYVAGCSATIDGRGGKDYIEHGNYDAYADSGYDCTSGRTTLRGGSGNDTIRGRKRDDRIYGGAGNDRIETGDSAGGRNKAWGGPGNDVLKGARDKDLLVGGAGNDVLNGRGARDTTIGGRGRDTCKAEVKKSCER